MSGWQIGLVMAVPVLLVLAAWGELDKALRRDAPWQTVGARLLIWVLTVAGSIGGFVWLIWIAG